MPIVVGIDGTGDQSTYERDFQDSFVRRICTKLNHDFNSLYNRGPNMVGYGLEAAVDRGFDFIYTRWKQFNDRDKGITQPVLLTGYSRGGTGVIEIAKRLMEKGIPVKAMMLFDCVDRQVNMDSSIIPENVSRVLHVTRSPLSRSRRTFKNAGLVLAGPKTSYRGIKIINRFICSHGAMGGTTWDLGAGETMDSPVNEGRLEGVIAETFFNGGFGNFLKGGGTYGSVARGSNITAAVTYREDLRRSEQVWSDVQPFLREEGFKS